MQLEIAEPTVLYPLWPKWEYTPAQVRMADHWVNLMRPGILFVLEPPEVNR